MMASYSADRNRCAGRPIRGGSGRRNGTAGHRGHHREAVDVRQFALVGRHSEGGVSLKVLHRAKSLSLGERNVRRRDIVLKVDKGFSSRNVPERRYSESFIVNLGRNYPLCGKANVVHDPAASIVALCKTVAQKHLPIGRSRRDETWWRGVRHEGRDLVTPSWSPIVVAGQAQVWIPSARDAKRINLNCLSPIPRADVDRAKLGTAACRDDLAASDDICGRATVPQRCRYFCAAVDDSHYLDSASIQQTRGLPAAVVIGK